MIGLASGLKVFVCTQPADMRRSFDGLCGMAIAIIEQDPMSGHLFVFRNRNRDRLKILYWDRDGLAIWYKRLEKGTFQLPTDLIDKDNRPVKAEITGDQLGLLLGGIDLRSVERRKRYRHPNNPR
ncbi:MAG: IS66 family insertion sequence element accessory protein TnpB [Planctomycetota bacterium]